MLNNSPAIVAVTSYVRAEGEIALASPALLRVLEVAEEEDVVGRSWLDVLGPTAGREAKREDMEVLAAGTSKTFVTRMGVRGHRRTLMSTKFPLQRSGFREVAMVALDVTDHRRHDRLMRLTFDLSPVPMARLAASGAILDANGALSDLLGGPGMRLRGSDLASFLEQGEVLPAADGQVSEVRMSRLDGRGLWVALSINEVDGDGDDESFALAVLEDVTIRRDAQAELMRRARHDALTGLPNRYDLQEELTQSLRRLRETKGFLAVMFCDLDGFKTLNDTLSHRAGDHVLIEVARRLRRTVAGHDVVARLGGDEFVVIAHGIADRQQAVQIAEDICGVIRDPFDVGGRHVRLGISIGLTLTDEPSTRDEDLLRQADLAMYRAKENGRNRVESYVPELEAAVIGRMQVEEHLRRALALGTVAVRYQPIVSLDGSGVSAVEALVRIPNPDRIEAAAFIEAAERTGLIRTLGEQVLHRVVQDVRRWAVAGASTRVHLNVSRSQLGESGFAADCLDALGSDVSAGNLCVEVGDSTTLVGSEDVVQALWDLRALGFHVGIDGFGGGHSGLESLRRIPADYLKIDRSLIKDLPGAHEDRVIVEAIVKVAHALGRTVIATGVECHGQVDALRMVGCDEAQGFLHSPAVVSVRVPDLVVSLS